MYNLPKIHEVNVSLRPILSMVCSILHELAKWLVEILDPVLKFSFWLLYSRLVPIHTYVKCNVLLTLTFSCLLIFYLFTNFPHDETIDICSDYLYNWPLQPPSIPETELMEMASISVSFSFNNNMYQQIDGLSSYDQYLCRVPWEAIVFKPCWYFCYIDDTFACFSSHNGAEIFSTFK